MFKKIYDNLDEINKIYNLVKEYMTNYYPNLSEENMQCTSNVKPDREFKLQALKDIFDFKNTGTVSAFFSIEAEFDKYINFTITNTDLDLLTFWRDHKNMFPRLSQLTKYFLSIPATSTASERAFSISGAHFAKKAISIKFATCYSNIILKTQLFSLIVSYQNLNL